MDDSSRRRLSLAYADVDYNSQQLVDALNQYVLSQEKNLSDFEGRQFALVGEIKMSAEYDKTFAKIEDKAVGKLEDDEFVEDLVTTIVKLDHRKQEDSRIKDSAKKEVDGFEKIIDEMASSLKAISDALDTTTLPTTAGGGEPTSEDMKTARACNTKLKKLLATITKEHDEARAMLPKIQDYYIGLAEHRVYQQMTLKSLIDKMQKKRDEKDSKKLKKLHLSAYEWSQKCYDFSRGEVDGLEAHEAEAEMRLSLSQSSRRRE